MPNFFDEANEMEWDGVWGAMTCFEIDKNKENLLAFEKALNTFLSEACEAPRGFFQVIDASESQLLLDKLYAFYSQPAFQGSHTLQPRFKKTVELLYAKRDELVKEIDQVIGWIKQLCRYRWKDLSRRNIAVLLRYHRADSKELLDFKINCDSIDEAVLLWHTVSEQLKLLFDIAPHHFYDNMDARVHRLNNGMYQAGILYSLEELQHVQPYDKSFIKTRSFNLFRQRDKTYQDYFSEQLDVIKDDSVSTETASAAYKEVVHTRALDHIAMKERLTILIGTETGRALGNLTFTMMLAKALAKQPGWKVIVCVGLSGYENPGYNLPDNVICHFASTGLIELYPVIKHYASQPDTVVVSMNSFLYDLEQLWGLSFKANQSTPRLLISEYNSVHQYSGDSYVELGPGLRQKSNKSLGIIKPATLPAFSKAVTRRQLQQHTHPKIKAIFSMGIDAPLYLGYIYNPKHTKEISALSGFNAVDILIIFLGHMAAAEHSSAKFILSLSERDLSYFVRADKYKTLLDIFRITYFSSVTDDPIEVGRGSQHVFIYNFFPLPHAAFRLLMSDAMACDTPVAVTGDQSLMEVFFAHPRFTFLYQVLAHKLPLYESLLMLCDEEQFPLLHELLKLAPAQSLSAADLLSMGEGLFEHREIYYHEMVGFRQRIHDQPNLLNGIKRIVNACASRCDELKQDARQPEQARLGGRSVLFQAVNQEETKVGLAGSVFSKST